MNTKKIKSLIDQIKFANALTTDGSPLLTASANVTTCDAIGDPDNEVVYISWGESGDDFSIVLTEQGLDKAVIKGHIIELEDCEGDSLHVSLYDVTTKNIEKW